MIFRGLAQAGFLWGALRRRCGMVIATQLHHASLGAVGLGTVFQSGAHFRPPAAIQFGRNCYVWRGVNASTEHPQGFLSVADNVQLNADVHLDMTGGLTIGAHVLISEGAVLYTHDHGLDPRAVPALLPKLIGAGAWIGMRAVILPKCQHIGAGAVIGAGAIVTADVPAGAIMAGNPARQVGRKALTEVAA